MDGPAEEVEAKIQGIQGVENISRATGQAGRAAWQVETGKDPAIRSELARAVIESGWGLYEIRSVGLSLEDIFLKLTGAESEETAGDPGTEDASEEDSAAQPPAEDAPEAEKGADA